MIKKPKKTPFYKKKLFIIPIAVIVLILLAFRFSPFPGAAVIRVVFDHDAQQKKTAMRAVVGEIDDVTITSNISYRKHDSAALLDVYAPKNATSTAPLPVVVWTHGGAWLSGDKTDTVAYFEKLAQQGFVVVALNYSLAPAKKYPYQVHQINDAYGFIAANIGKYNGDNSRMVFAGDSAGAQLTSQLAAIATNPSYAKEMDVVPAIKPAQISALVLYCGIYKVQDLAEPHPGLSKLISWGNSITIWSLLGSRDANNPLIQQMSAYYHVNDQYPHTFISGGNADALTKAQSVPFSAELKSKNVDVETLFYSDDHTPALSHENQFVLNKDGLENFKVMTDYLKLKTQSVPTS